MVSRGLDSVVGGESGADGVMRRPRAAPPDVVSPRPNFTAPECRVQNRSEHASATTASVIGAEASMGRAWTAA